MRLRQVHLHQLVDVLSLGHLQKSLELANVPETALNSHDTDLPPNRHHRAQNTNSSPKENSAEERTAHKHGAVW